LEEEMSDIVEVLRAPAKHSWAVIHVEEFEIAASLIEQLRAEKIEDQEMANSIIAEHGLEIERLKAYIDELEHAEIGQVTDSV
jgi:hypothetical protein